MGASEEQAGRGRRTLNMALAGHDIAVAATELVPCG
jgi:hypothetical protein